MKSKIIYDLIFKTKFECLSLIANLKIIIIELWFTMNYRSESDESEEILITLKLILNLILSFADQFFSSSNFERSS